MKVTQINPLNLERISELDRLGIFGKTRLGKSYLANKIANWLVQTHQVFIFHPYDPCYHRDEVPPPYELSASINFKTVKFDDPIGLIAQLERILQNNRLKIPKAIILDEILSYKQNAQNFFSLLQKHEKNNINIKIIILSHEPTVIFQDWNKFHKLFTCLEYFMEKQLKDFLEKQSKNLDWREREKCEYYCDWLNCLHDIDRENQYKSRWVLDEIGKPLTQEILVVDRLVGR